jgi:succinyl-diaminopimelate desuccinylase
MTAPPTDALAAAVRARAPDIAALTERLVTTPTENPPGARYEECVAVLGEALDDLGLAPRTLDDAGLCLGATLGAGGRPLVFHGHYDVVPAQRPDQFTPRREGGVLLGRGTADMKGGVAAMVYAMVALREAGVPLNGRVELELVPDEETGGARGSAALAPQGRLHRDAVAMLTAEPTGGVVWNANRGAISLRITVRGRSAHVGLSHAGVNAFEGMLRVAERMREWRDEIGERVTRFAIQPEAARHSILLIGGESGGGDNFNVVPDTCTFTVDRRSNPEEDLDRERQALLEIVEAARDEGLDVEAEVFQEAPAAATEESDPAARALAASIERVEGAPPRFEMCPGLLEIRFYAPLGVPALAYGPGGLDVAHQAAERVELAALERCATVYALTAARLLV